MQARDGDAIVSEFGGKRVAGKGWMFCCPAHDDKKPSCFMSVSGVLYCHAGCSPKDVAAALDAAGFKATAIAQPVRPSDIRQAREAEIRKAQRLWEDAAHYDHAYHT